MARLKVFSYPREFGENQRHALGLVKAGQSRRYITGRHCGSDRLLREALVICEAEWACDCLGMELTSVTIFGRGVSVMRCRRKP